MIKRILIAVSTVICLLATGLLVYLFMPPFPRDEWEIPPEEKVFDVFYFGEVDYNYIPDVQIWGNGHIVWVKHDARGNRLVMEGYLSKQELTLLINEFIEAGFFTGYSRLNWYMHGGNTIAMYLPYFFHKIAIDNYIGYSNHRVLRLVDSLRGGAGIKGKEFVPDRAEIYAIPIEELDKKEYPENSNANYQWPDERFGYTLDSVPEREITGEELDFAWNIVNDPNPLVLSNGKIYWIAVIPSFETTH